MCMQNSIEQAQLWLFPPELIRDESFTETSCIAVSPSCEYVLISNARDRLEVLLPTYYQRHGMQ